MPFARVVAAGRERGEVAIGYRIIEHAGRDATVVVNPSKSSIVSFGADDRIVVIGPPE